MTDPDLDEILTATPIVEWDAFLSRCSSHPFEALSRINSTSVGGGGPLAWLLSRDPPLHVVKSVLSRFRDEICVYPLEGRGGGIGSASATALHQACTLSDSDSVILAVLDAHPSAAAVPNRYGSLPLHCCVRSSVAAAALVRAHPEALSTRNRGGNLPLHLAAYASSPDHLEMLVEEGKEVGVGVGVVGNDAENDGDRRRRLLGDGGVLVRNDVGETPFELTRFRAEMSLEWADDDGDDGGGGGGPREKVRTVRGSEAHRDWEKLCVVLREVSPSSVDKKGKFLPLHAAIKTGSSEKIVCRALRTHPDQLRIRDGNGDLPLHVALSAPGTSHRVLKWLLSPDGKGGYRKAAGLPDGRGRLPLHSAAAKSCKYDDIVEGLLLAEPGALEMRDVLTGLYPFMIASMDRAGVGLIGLDTSFNLLRECPHLTTSG